MRAYLYIFGSEEPTKENLYQFKSNAITAYGESVLLDKLFDSELLQLFKHGLINNYDLLNTINPYKREV